MVGSTHPRREAIYPSPEKTVELNLFEGIDRVPVFDCKTPMLYHDVLCILE
jgi:hypothetical protein